MFLGAFLLENAEESEIAVRKIIRRNGWAYVRRLHNERKCLDGQPQKKAGFVFEFIKRKPLKKG